MEQKRDIEYLLVDSTGVNELAIAAGLNWLAAHGGGCVLTPDKHTVENALDIETDGQFKKAETKLGRYGITLSWKRRGMPFSSRSIIALYMDKDIDEVIQRGTVERIFFIPWMESESSWFKDAYKPTIVEVNEDGNLEPLANQPHRQNMDYLIARLPEDLVLPIWSSAISTCQTGHKYGVLGSFSVSEKTELHFRPHLPAVLRGRFSVGGEIPFENYSKR